MSLNENTVTPETDEISLKDLILKIKEIWRYLLSKWRIIVLIGLLGAALGLVYALTKKVEYKATLSFAIQEKGNSGGGLAALAGQFGVSIGGGTEGIFSGSNILELLKSRNLIERTLLSKVKADGKEQSLIDYYIEKNEIKEEWAKSNLPFVSFPLEQKRADFSRVQDSTLNAIANTLTYKKLDVSKQSKEASIINVSFTNEDEVLAKYFTDILVKEVIDFYVLTRTEVPRVNLAIMEAKADSTKAKLEALTLKQAREADRNLDAIRLVSKVSQQRDMMEIQLLGTVYTELIKNIEALKMDLIRETPFIQIIDTPIFPLEKTGFGKAKGIVLGGLLGGFLIIIYLLGVRFYRNIMNDGEENSPS